MTAQPPFRPEPLQLPPGPSQRVYTLVYSDLGTSFCCVARAESEAMAARMTARHRRDGAAGLTKNGGPPCFLLATTTDFVHFDVLEVPLADSRPTLCKDR